jgi:hypothetical protein
MTLGQFLQRYHNLDPDTVLVIPASDHSYEAACVCPNTALYDVGTWTEDYGEASTPEAEYGKRRKVLVIG